MFLKVLIKERVDDRASAGWCVRTAVLTSSEWVHQCGVCSWRGCGNCRLRLADLRVAFSELQPNCLRHVGVEPDALL